MQKKAEGFSSVLAHGCRHTRKTKLWQWLNWGTGTWGREQERGKSCRDERSRMEPVEKPQEVKFLQN